MKITYYIDKEKYTFDFLLNPKKIKNVNEILGKAIKCGFDMQCSKCPFESVGHSGCFKHGFDEKTDVVFIYKKYILGLFNYKQEEMDI